MKQPIYCGRRTGLRRNKKNAEAWANYITYDTVRVAVIMRAATSWVKD